MHDHLPLHGVKTIGRRIWQQSPAVTYAGPLAELEKLLPEFRREPWRVSATDNGNTRLDAIIRVPDQYFHESIPVGAVSKTYSLIQHRDVYRAALQAMADLRLPVQALQGELTISEYGERMSFDVFLPPAFSLSPRDGHPVALRIKCLNSVEGSTSFRAWFDWFRLICRNGLMVGLSSKISGHRHTQTFNLGQMSEIIDEGLALAAQESRLLKQWEETPVGRERLEHWVEKDVRAAWGFKSAARVYQIALHGHDCDITGGYRDRKPTTVEVNTTQPVPGSPQRVTNVYELSQVLSWVACRRNDVDESHAWIGHIPKLMERFHEGTSAGEA